MGKSNNIFNILPPKLEMTVGKQNMRHHEADDSPVTSDYRHWTVRTVDRESPQVYQRELGILHYILVRWVRGNSSKP